MFERKQGIDDCGIFLGLSTIPLPLKQGKAFFKREIQNGIFKQYKDRITSFSFNKEKDDTAIREDFDQYLYRAKAYYLFGSFDLAVLALVDDFKLGSKTFHPYSHLTEEALANADGRLLQPENFIFQTLTGYAPQLIAEHPSLLETACETFLREEEKENPRFPLFSSCSLKLNNAFTVGGGNTFIQLVASMITSHLEASPDYKEHFDFILLQTFSWNEFTLLFFSDSYSTITKHILQIRELNFKDLKLFDYGNNSFIESIRKEALLSHLIKDDNEVGEKLDFAHIFVHSQSIFGFDIDLFEDENIAHSPKFKQLRDESLNLNIQLFVKPGHLKTVAQYFDQKSENWRLHIGKGDFIYPVPDGNLRLSYRELLHSTDLESINKHIRGLQTHPELSFELDEIAGELVEDHFFYSQKLGRFAFTIEDLRRLRDYLVRCKVSKTVRERVINMYVNFNYGIQDPVLFAYFIDLHSFLTKTLNDIAALTEEDDQSVEETSDSLSILSNDFEKAFRNRFHLSYLMSEMADINMDFNGGVQQLVSLFDSVYKIMASVLQMPMKERPSLCVSSISGIASNDNSVEMSYAHLLQPSLFLSTATATVAKSFFNRNQNASETYVKFIQKTALVQNLSLMETLPFLEDLSELFGDMINYYITFNKDTELFLFWYWHYFLQNPDMYNQKGEVNEELFCLYLLRLMFVFEYLDPDSGHFKAQVLAPNHDLQDLWFRWFPRTREKLDEILSEGTAEHLDEWFSMAKAIIEDELIIDNYSGILEKNLETEEERTALYKEILRNSDGALSNNLYELEMDLIKARYEEMNYLSDQVASLLRSGRIYNPDVLSVRSSAFYLQVIVLAYLKLIHTECNGRLTVLHRDEKTGTPSDQFDEEGLFKRIYPNYTFDPRGGLFLTSIQARRNYFRYRIALYNSLNSIASKMKKELF